MPRRDSPIRTTPALARVADGTLAIKLAAATLESGTADVTLFVYDRRHTTRRCRRSGENTGRTLENYNVVRRF